MKVFQNSETLPVPLMNYLRSREQKWYRVSTVYSLTSRGTEIAISPSQPKLQGPLPKDVLVPPCPERNSFCDLITVDHKVLSEESESRDNHRYAIVVQDLATQCDSARPSKDQRFFWCTCRIPPYFCERPVTNTSIRIESFNRYMSQPCIVRGESLKRRR